MLHGCWTEDQRQLPKVCTCKLINSTWKLSNRNCLSSQGNWRSSFPSFGTILRRAERFDESMTRTPLFFVVRNFLLSFWGNPSLYMAASKRSIATHAVVFIPYETWRSFVFKKVEDFFFHTGSLAIQLNGNSDPCLFRVRLKTGGQKENSSKMARLSINCSKLLLLENRLCSWTVFFFLVWVTLSTFLVFLLDTWKWAVHWFEVWSFFLFYFVASVALSR